MAGRDQHVDVAHRTHDKRRYGRHHFGGRTSAHPWLRRTWHLAAAACGLVLLAGAALAVYGVRAQPRMDGKLVLAGLERSVWVRRDESDVTHISAQSPQDVWRALGFVHAQERGWQLEFNRRLMQGRLSEILGPATLELDKLMRALDIHGAARRQYAALPPRCRRPCRPTARV
jgi:penicillin amidase